MPFGFEKLYRLFFFGGEYCTIASFVGEIVHINHYVDEASWESKENTVDSIFFPRFDLKGLKDLLRDY